MEVSSILARILLEADEEVQAVRLLHEALQDLPMDYALLDCQAAFCKQKGEGEMALECAKRSVTAAPSEFTTWARLAEIYVGMERWELALLTLNSCPMFTYQDKDAPRMPDPSRVVLPVLPETMLDEIDEGQPKQGEPWDQVHQTLRKLHAAGYQGTFLKAYSLLTQVAASIGWDQLLKIRSHVFVMEEEYRNERETVPAQSRNASTVALRAPSPNVNGTSSEEHDKEQQASLDPSNDQEPSATSSQTRIDGVAENAMLTANESVEKPSHTVASEVVKAGSDDVSPPSLS